MPIQPRQWGIYWVKWRFDDDPTQEKARPGILISRPDLIAQDVLYFLYVTTVRKDEPWCIHIPADELWFPTTGLRKDCYCYVKRCGLFQASDILPGRSGFAPKPLQGMIDLVIREGIPNLKSLAYGSMNPPSPANPQDPPPEPPQRSPDGSSS